MKLAREDTETVASRLSFVSKAIENDKDFLSAMVSALTSCLDVNTMFEFKVQLDRKLKSKGKGYSGVQGGLHHMVFNQLSGMQRHAVLTHFKAVVCQHDDKDEAPKLIISDIDDTIYPSFKDCRGFLGSSPYPGATAFLGSLSAHNHISFVTARPPFLATRTHSDLSKIGFAMSQVLMGTPTSAVSGNMLTQKLKQVREMSTLWPECEIVLVGDNGQMDIDLGLALLNESLAQHVFIHDIYFWEERNARNPPRLSKEGKLMGSSSRLGYRQEECIASGIHMFSSYPTALMLAKQFNLISAQQLESAALQCAQDLAKQQKQLSVALKQHLLKDFAQLIPELDHLCDSAKSDVWRHVLTNLF